MSARAVLAGLAVAGAVLVGVLVLGADDGRYLVRLEMANAGGLRQGANVRVGGAPAGEVKKVRLNEDDIAVAELRLEPGVAPIGAGARAVVDTDGLFGERFVEIDRGDMSRPQPDGSLIPAQRASVSVRLDDVVDALDLDTRQALRAFLNEQGAAIAGRGRDLGALLEALPPSLDRTGELLDQFAADNQALGRLVESSDRVVGEVADERRELGRLVSTFGETLDTLDGRRGELGETVRRAPATLQSARRALVALDETAAPLIPAARGLRRTAEPLTATLEELPDFAEDSVPALNTARRVAGDLQRLAVGATPAVQSLRPTAEVLSDYTRRGLNPFTALLDEVTPDVFGVMEGWARSTQGRDAASHIFRFGASTGSDSLAGLLTPPRDTARRTPRRTPRPAKDTAPAATAQPSTPAPSKPRTPSVQLPRVPKVPEVLDKVDEVLKQDPADAVRGLVDGLTGKESAGPGQGDLLDFLLAP